VKIDAFCHIMPRPYYDRFFARLAGLAVKV
jgi:hypothetical protein